MTTVWVDADACPRPVRDVLFRAADKRRVQVVLVANQSMAVPRSPFIRCVTVPKGFDVADDAIVAEAQPGDLAITQDVPLAAELVAQGVAVLDPRGNELDRHNIGSRLAARNLREDLRGAGLITGGGPAEFSDRDKQTFANSFDRVLTRLLRAAG